MIYFCPNIKTEHESLSFLLSLGSLFLNSVFLEWTHECLLFLARLEASMTKLAAGINKLEVNLLKSSSLSVGQQRFAESDNTLLRSHRAAQPSSHNRNCLAHSL